MYRFGMKWRRQLVGLIAACMWASSGAAATNDQKQEEPLADSGVSYLCVVSDSGMVLAEQNADQQRPPASIIKMFQLLLVVEGLQRGAWTLETPITISEHARNMGGTQVFLNTGDTWPLGQLMEAVAVASANDAAMAVAEGLWGSEEAYKEAMNKRAAELGMAHSSFRSVHGLPPDKGEEADQTTARDVARLASECVRHPQILAWTSLREIEFPPGKGTKENTNRLPATVPGCDGLKTGYTQAAGFCVAATAMRDHIRLIAIVMGHPNSKKRFALAGELLENGFKQVERVRFLTAGQPIGDPTPVHNCATQQIRLTALHEAWAIVRTGEAAKAETVVRLPDRVYAPVRAGTPVGEVHIRLGDLVLCSVPLVVPQDLEAAGWRWKLFRRGSASTGRE